MNIGIDIDNVISNFNEALLKEFLIHDKKLRNKGIVNENADYITRGMFDWSKNEVKDFYKNNIERIAQNLDVIDGAKKYIDKLKKDGHTIIIISARDNGEYSDPYNLTKGWLSKFDIYYDKLVLTNNLKNDKSAKTRVCLENNVVFMIDDSEITCKDCIENGISALLMDTPFNRCEQMKRVYSWKEIYQIISKHKQEKINVILDTDTYNECDDQFALAYTLKSQDIFNIEAITVAPFSHKRKNVSIEDGQELSYKEILKICKWLKFDTKSKVFKGSMGYIQDGYNEDNDAVNKIIEVALKNEKTYVMAIGALTNIALAIRKEPKIMNKIEIVWLGGNSLLQEDNKEFNFRQDIQAVRDVFSCKAKLTVIPCKNVASNLVTSIYELKHLLQKKNKLCDYLIKRFYNDGYHGIQERRVIWDISVVAYLINRSWFETKQIRRPVINDDTSYSFSNKKQFITMATFLYANNIYADLFKKLGEEWYEVNERWVEIINRIL